FISRSSCRKDIEDSGLPGRTGDDSSRTGASVHEGPVSISPRGSADHRCVLHVILAAFGAAMGARMPSRPATIIHRPAPPVKPKRRQAFRAQGTPRGTPGRTGEERSGGGAGEGATGGRVVVPLAGTSIFRW